MNTDETEDTCPSGYEHSVCGKLHGRLLSTDSEKGYRSLHQTKDNWKFRCIGYCGARQLVTDDKSDDKCKHGIGGTKKGKAHCCDADECDVFFCDECHKKRGLKEELNKIGSAITENKKEDNVAPVPVAKKKKSRK